MSGLSTDGRNDEAVRRLREESARRIAREARWRTFAAWCAVVTLAAGFRSRASKRAIGGNAKQRFRNQRSIGWR